MFKVDQTQFQEIPLFVNGGCIDSVNLEYDRAIAPRAIEFRPQPGFGAVVHSFHYLAWVLLRSYSFLAHFHGPVSKPGNRKSALKSCGGEWRYNATSLDEQTKKYIHLVSVRVSVMMIVLPLPSPVG